MGLNSEGIYEWEGDDDFTEWRDELTDSVTDTVADIRAEITGLAVPADSGWVNISTFGTGWTNGSSPLQARVRKIGNRVDLTGGVVRTTTTGLVTNVLTIPVGYRPPGNVVVGLVMTNGGQALLAQIPSSSGVLTFPTGYATTAIGSGVTVLFGMLSWYVD